MSSLKIFYFCSVMKSTFWLENPSFISQFFSVKISLTMYSVWEVKDN